jgi:hypothetical protein
MTSREKKGIILMAVAATLFSTIGCRLNLPEARIGELQTKSESVQLGDVDSVSVVVNMGAGELVMSSGASDLLEAEFVYNVEELEPVIDYRNGTLTVSFPDVNLGIESWWEIDDYRNEWDLRLNDDVPMELSVEVGAGVSNLNVGSLSLTNLTVTTGAGDVMVDLSGSSLLSRLDIDAGVGRLTLDLTGDWQNNLDASIRAGVGQLTVHLPRTACVRVEIDGGIANVDTSGLSRDGDDFINDACGESDVTLRIGIEAGVGNIELELGD